MPDDFVGSPELIVLARSGDRRLTKDRTQGSCAVWSGSRILAYGSEAMCRRIYDGLPADAKPEPEKSRPAPTTEQKGQLSLF
jgi:hypothetical protein